MPKNKNTDDFSQLNLLDMLAGVDGNFSSAEIETVIDKLRKAKSADERREVLEQYRKENLPEVFRYFGRLTTKKLTILGEWLQELHCYEVLLSMHRFWCIDAGIIMENLRIVNKILIAAET